MTKRYNIQRQTKDDTQHILYTTTGQKKKQEIKGNKNTYNNNISV